MQQVADSYRAQIDKELPAGETRPFYLGHPDFTYTQIPARDGVAHGQILRSNRYPNCSFFMNWVDPRDSISWEVEVPADGRFKVSLYYSCPMGDEGSLVELSMGNDHLQARIEEAWDPPLRGMDEDLFQRIESYVKDWKTMELGVMDLHAGKGTLSLKALEMPGRSVMDFRLLMFERL